VTAADPPRPVTVTGGSGGVQADCAALAHLARRFGTAGLDALEAALALHALLVLPAFVGSALFDPAGFAAAEAELLWALDGPQGLSWAGEECGALALELRGAAAAYAEVDRLSGAIRDAVTGALLSGPALIDGARVLADTGSPVAAAEAVVADDPALGDVLVNGLGVPALLRAAAGQWPDGHPVVGDDGADTDGAAGRVPRGLTDVLAGLEERDSSGRSGAIDVRILTLADGSRRVIVDVTGTRSWDPLPTTDVTSLATNGRALVGDRTSYEQGVLIAMRRAGVRRDDPVMIVGHSQGGMVAVTAARDAVRSGEFDVTHVVTAGSPVGLTVGQLPRRVQVLAIENSKDVVPHLDGRANPDRPNVTTVTGTRGDGTVLDDHSLDDAYVPLAGDVQASGDRSVRDFLGSADGYFRAVSVQTHAYVVRRAY